MLLLGFQTEACIGTLFATDDSCRLSSVCLRVCNCACVRARDCVYVYKHASSQAILIMLGWAEKHLAVDAKPCVSPHMPMVVDSSF
jgi:hypothetical protein